MKSRLFIIAALSICGFASSPVAHAQQIQADTGGVAIGGDVSNSTININNINGISAEELAALVRQNRDLSEAQKKLIAKLESELDLNQRQIHAALDILGERDVAPERLGDKLVEIAERFKTLQAAASANLGDDHRIAALKAGAQKAIDEGDLAKADQLLADVEAEQKRALDRLAANAADTSYQRGLIAVTRLRYAEGAMHFAKAAAVFPQERADQPKRTKYLMSEAWALAQQGAEFGDNGALFSAIEKHRQLIAQLSREDAPLVWALVQNRLANALAILGKREANAARQEEAVAAFREALKESTRERAPYGWAMIQKNLGSALLSMGERESTTNRLEDAIIAYREALKELTRERTPLEWAQAQAQLCDALHALGTRENNTARQEQAAAACREALTESTRDRAPLDWAGAEAKLGNVLLTLGRLENDAPKLEEAVSTYREALKELSRERVPLAWASAQNNLGVALVALGKQQNNTLKVEEAVAVLREALKERTRQRMPVDWALTQHGLGGALLALGTQENDVAKLQEAVAAHREALTELTKERWPSEWAEAKRGLGAALQSLGYFCFVRGDFATAVPALQEGSDANDPYPVLWLYLARARLGSEEAKRKLEQGAVGLKPTEWPFPVIRLFLEQDTPQAMMASADKPEERCEAQFYLGQWYLLRDARADAIGAMRNAVEVCLRDFMEYKGALAELRRFGQ